MEPGRDSHLRRGVHAGQDRVVSDCGRSGIKPSVDFTSTAVAMLVS